MLAKTSSSSQCAKNFERFDCHKDRQFPFKWNSVYRVIINFTALWTNLLIRADRSSLTPSFILEDCCLIKLKVTESRLILSKRQENAVILRYVCSWQLHHEGRIPPLAPPYSCAFLYKDVQLGGGECTRITFCPFPRLLSPLSPLLLKSLWCPL